jgi:hypothetical protein
VLLPGCRVNADDFRQQTANWCAWDQASLATGVAPPKIDGRLGRAPAEVDDSRRIPIELGPGWVRVGERGDRQTWSGVVSAELIMRVEEEVAKFEQLAEQRSSSAETLPAISWSLTANAELDAGGVVALIERLALAGLPEGELWLAYDDPARPQPPNDVVGELAAQVEAAEQPGVEVAKLLAPLVDECPMIAPGFAEAAAAAPADRCEAMLDGVANSVAQCRWRPGSADRLLAGLYLASVGTGPLHARVPVRIDWLAPAQARPTGTWAEFVSAEFRAWQPWVGGFERSSALIEAAREQGCDRARGPACRVSCVAGDQAACAEVRGDDRVAYFQLACDRAKSGWDCRALAQDLEGEGRAAVATRIDALSGPACEEQAIADECEVLYWRHLLWFQDDRDLDRAAYFAQRTCDLGGACLAASAPKPKPKPNR